MGAQSNGTNGTCSTSTSVGLKSIKPFFPSPATTNASENASESPAVTSIIKSLNLIPHIEGGYFAETDRATDTVPSPFPLETHSTGTTELAPQRPGFDPAVRNSSTSIHYYLTPSGPQGGFHRNKARTVHTLHKGRGKYVIIHADEPDMKDGKRRVEVFTVGHDVAAGEKLQWIVEGGKFKGTFLLPDREGGSESEGLLISETVVPGFEYCDHDFLSRQHLVDLLGEEGEKELGWLLSPLASGLDKP